MTLSWQTVLARPRSLPPLLMAHRGSCEELPENTLAAFERALAQGADVLETDIRFTRDDEIVLMHDATLDRTTNGTGMVAQMSLAEIKRYRAQRSLDSNTTLGDEEIRTLAEFLEWSGHSGMPNDTAPHFQSPDSSAAPPPRAVPIALELKDDQFMEARSAERLVQLLAKHSALERTVLLSFNSARIHACKRVAPAIPIGIITLKNPFPLSDTELLGPFFPLLYVNPLYIAWARRLGKIACPLDPTPEPRLGFYRRLGAPVLLTNHPATTRKFVL